MTTKEHLPYIVYENDTAYDARLQIADNENLVIAELPGSINEQKRNRVAFIVQACNAHYTLTRDNAALREIVQDLIDNPNCEKTINQAKELLS